MLTITNPVAKTLTLLKGQAFHKIILITTKITSSQILLIQYCQIYILRQNYPHQQQNTSKGNEHPETKPMDVIE